MSNTYYEKLDTLDPMERELYRILKTFKDNFTHTCHPSIATLTKLFKRCRNTTRKYLRKLQAKGFIFIEYNRVTHEVTDNKFNETNTYTLLLDKLNGAVAKVKKKIETKTIELKETRLDSIIRDLKKKHDSIVVESAVRTMNRNQRNGIIVKSPKSYLETLIEKSNNQLLESDKAIESFTESYKGQSNNKSNNNKYKPNKAKRNDYKTKFHNFKQRTDKYTDDELENIIRSKSKREVEEKLKDYKDNNFKGLQLTGILDHSRK